MLEPYAERGWLKRFDAVKNKGQKFWLYVVRDFNIQHPKVEYLVDDIVRSLESRKEKKSLVRAEMNKLEAEGKLNIDTPEEEEKWEKRLQKEREEQDEWEAMDQKAREEQRALDEAFLIEKAKKGEEISPIADTRQDPVKNPEMLKTTEIKGEGTIDDEGNVETKITEVGEEKELTELEKKQEAFVPKPPPEKAPEKKGPKLKEVEADGEVVYNKDEQQEVKPGIDTLGLPKDAIKRLKDIGVTKVAHFEKMDKGQAKNILGQALYTKHEKLFKS